MIFLSVHDIDVFIPARQRIPHYTIFAQFDDKEMTVEASPQAIEKARAKVKDESKIQALKEVNKYSTFTCTIHI